MTMTAEQPDEEAIFLAALENATRPNALLTCETPAATTPQLRASCRGTAAGARAELATSLRPPPVELDAIAATDPLAGERPARSSAATSSWS